MSRRSDEERLGAEPADYRTDLLDRLRYLLVEAEALGPLLESLPPSVLTTRPFGSTPPLGERSVLEVFAYLATLDREVYTPSLPSPEAAPPEGEQRGGEGVRAVLDEVRAARTGLLAAFEALAPAEWEQPVTLPDGTSGTAFDLAAGIALHDAEVLRALAYRLHEAHLTSREQDLPK